MTIRIRNLAGTSLAALLLLTALACGGGERPAASGERRRRLPPAHHQGVRHDGHPRPAPRRGVHEDASWSGRSGQRGRIRDRDRRADQRLGRPRAGVASDEGRREGAGEANAERERRRDGRRARLARRFRPHLESGPEPHDRAGQADLPGDDHELEGRRRARCGRSFSTGARARPARTTTSASTSSRKRTSRLRVQTLQGTAAIINAVARDPRGIGYGGIAYAKDVRRFR